MRIGGVGIGTGMKRRTRIYLSCLISNSNLKNRLLNIIIFIPN